METPKTFLFDFSISKLNKLGLLCKSKTSNMDYLISGIFLFFVCYDLIISFMQYFYIGNSIEDKVKTFEGVTYFIQVTGKLIICLITKEKFVSFMERCSKIFLSTSKCSEKIKNNIEVLTSRIVRIQKIFVFSVIVALVIKITLSIVQRELVVGNWSMKKYTLLFYFTWISMMIQILFIAVFTLCYDCVFLGFCCEVIIQFKILFEQLQQLRFRDTDSDEKLTICVKQHQLILEYHQELQNIYSTTFLIQYLTASPLICFQMFAAFEAATIDSKLSYTIYIICLIVQIAFYCIPAEFMSNEMTSLSAAIYNSDWYSQHNVILRTPLVLLMQRAQRESQMTACGLIKMNINTVTMLCKFSLSTSLALQQLKK